MAKLSTLIDKLFATTPENMTTAQADAYATAEAALTEYLKAMKETELELDIMTKKYREARKEFGDDAMITQKVWSGMKDTEYKLQAVVAKFDEGLNRLKEEFKLTEEEINQVGDALNMFADTTARSRTRLKTDFENMDKLINHSFSNVSADMKKFFAEFGMFGALFAAAFVQIDKLSDKLVKFNRTMSLGYSSLNQGMDIYGNSLYGSLETITTGNNINLDNYLDSFQAFNKGNILGAGEALRSTGFEMQQFGITAGKLAKHFGVSMDTINTVTSNLVNNFGVKVKDLNKVLEDGKSAAFEAGISVKNYFERLKEATSLVGEQYIAGGIQGMQDLAIYAAKTDRSIGSIMATADKFKDFTSQYEMQNKATMMGLQQTAVNMTKAWSLAQLGRQGEADKLLTNSMAKDIANSGYFDNNGNIDTRAIRSLQQAGAEKEQIAQIQRMIALYKKHGVTIEEQTNVEKQSLMTKIKIAQYERQNATMAEKFGMLWQKIKSVFIDPIAAIMAPLFDILMSTVTTFIDVFSFLVKPVLLGFQTLGKGLTWVAEKVSMITSRISKGLEAVGLSFDKSSGALKVLTQVLGTVIASLIAFRVALAMKEGLSGMGSKLLNNLPGGRRGLVTMKRGIGGILEGAKGLFTRKGLLQAGKSLIPGRGTLSSAKGLLTGGGGLAKLAKGLGVGAILGIGGDMIGNAVGGNAGNTIGNVTSFAGTGASLGAFGGPIGMAIGAAVGAITGTVVSSWDKIETIWTDGSGGLFSNIWQSFMALFDTWFEGVKGMFDWMFGREDKAEKALDAAMATTRFTDTSAEVNKIIGTRRIENAFVAERAQAGLMNNNNTVNVKVISSFDGGVKTRINNQ